MISSEKSNIALQKHSTAELRHESRQIGKPCEAAESVFQVEVRDEGRRGRSEHPRRGLPVPNFGITRSGGGLIARSYQEVHDSLTRPWPTKSSNRAAHPVWNRQRPSRESANNITMYPNW